MRVIGLTGGIASGKSLVSAQLAELGAVVLDADKLGHETYRQGTDIYRELLEAFGSEVAGADGEIDRKVLGGKVFGNPEARQRLEAIVWPGIRRLAKERIDELAAKGVPIVVLEAAVLIEANWLDLADEVWLVEASPEIVRQRLAGRNGLSAAQIESRLQAQLTNEKRRPYANVVIENNGDLEALRRSVEEAWSKLQTRVEAR